MIELTDTGILSFCDEGEEFTLSFQDVFNALLELKKGYIPYPHLGICRNLYEQVSYEPSFKFESLINKLSSNWEHYSGVPGFPIPPTNKSKNARTMYRDTTLMWSKRTKYGRLRWQLLDHLIAELTIIKHKYDLQEKISLAVQEANHAGFNVTVKNVPLKPLSMGNTRTVIELRRSRGNY